MLTPTITLRIEIELDWSGHVVEVGRWFFPFGTLAGRYGTGHVDVVSAISAADAESKVPTTIEAALKGGKMDDGGYFMIDTNYGGGWVKLGVTRED